MNNVQLVSQALNILTILANVLVPAILIGLISGHLQKFVIARKITLQYFILFAYLVSMIATLGSLFFSDIAGYVPCKLCWYQRILMYPQTILLLVALIKNDKTIASYCIALSVVGAAMAFYHYLLQFGIIVAESCATVGFSVSCSERFVTGYGYITIPWMSFSAFALLISIWLTYKLSYNKQTFKDKLLSRLWGSK